MRKPISPKLRYQILARDNFTCRACGARAPNATLHVDHIKAVANGGSGDPSNLETLCITCNLGKSDNSVVVIAMPLSHGPVIMSTTEVRCRGEALSEPIFWVGEKWAVTSFGIERRDGTYTISKDRLWEQEPEWSWKQNMRYGKDDEWANSWDFNRAFDFAETHFAHLKPNKRRA